MPVSGTIEPGRAARALNLLNAMASDEKWPAVQTAIDDKHFSMTVGQHSTDLQQSGRSCALYAFLSLCFCLCGIELKGLLTRQHKRVWTPEALHRARVPIKTALEGIRPPRFIGYSNRNNMIRAGDTLQFKFGLPGGMTSRLELFSEPGHTSVGSHDTTGNSAQIHVKIPVGTKPGWRRYSAKVALDDTNGQLEYVIEIQVMISPP
jgi:hypothetical protein